MSRSSLWIRGLLCGLLPVLLAAEAKESEKKDREVRAVAERYFAAYAAKDVEGMMALWSDKAPDYNSRKQATKRIFAETGDIQLKELTIIQVETKNDSARVRVRVELLGTDQRSGKPHRDLGKLNRVLLLKREEGAWKLWRYVPAEQEMLERLLASKGEDSRNELYQDNKDLLSWRIVVMADGECWERMGRGRWDEASRLNELAFEIAGKLGDKNALAMCHYTRGNLNFRRSRYPEALASYERTVALSREVNNQSGEAQALSAIGDCYRAMSQYEQALRYYQDSLKIKRGRGDRKGEADTLNHLGIVYSSTGRYAEALRHYQDSLKIARQSSKKRSRQPPAEEISEKTRNPSAFLGFHGVSTVLHHSRARGISSEKEHTAKTGQQQATHPTTTRQNEPPWLLQAHHDRLQHPL